MLRRLKRSGRNTSKCNILWESNYRPNQNIPGASTPVDCSNLITAGVYVMFDDTRDAIPGAAESVADASVDDRAFACVLLAKNTDEKPIVYIQCMTCTNITSKCIITAMEWSNNIRQIDLIDCAHITHKDLKLFSDFDTEVSLDNKEILTVKKKVCRRCNCFPPPLPPPNKLNNKRVITVDLRS
jgi:hypothetical protein